MFLFLFLFDPGALSLPATNIVGREESEEIGAPFTVQTAAIVVAVMVIIIIFIFEYLLAPLCGVYTDLFGGLFTRLFVGVLSIINGLIQAPGGDVKCRSGDIVKAPATSATAHRVNRFFWSAKTVTTVARIDSILTGALIPNDAYSKLFNQLSNQNNIINSTSLDNKPQNENEHENDSGKLKTIIVDKARIYTSDVLHRFDILKITRTVSITVCKWNETTMKGGLLKLHGKSLILEKCAIINVNGKGYRGGKSSKVSGGYHGYSYNWESNESENANYGGGGGGIATSIGTVSIGVFSGFGRLYVGGGGDGTEGKHATNSKKTGSEGGQCYGDETLSRVNLCSGGGCGSEICKNHIESIGGDAIIIECDESIVISKGASIMANGENEKHFYGSGCGSGGSIFLKAPKIVNDGLIQAIGGINRNGNGGYGAGMGRIRIDCEKDSEIFWTNSNKHRDIEKNGQQHWDVNGIIQPALRTSCTNIDGGFLVTHRMLDMSKR